MIRADFTDRCIVQFRGRPEETTVILEYLQQLHQLHEDWLEREQQANIEELQVRETVHIVTI